MSTLPESERLDKLVGSIPGYAAWLAESDRDYWLGVLRSAAAKRLESLPACEGCGACERCVLDEALAYTGGDESGGIDLEELDRLSRRVA